MLAHEEKLSKRKPTLFKIISKYSFPELNLKNKTLSRVLVLEELLQIFIQNHYVLINSVGRYTSTYLPESCSKPKLVIIEVCDHNSPVVKLGALPKFILKIDAPTLNYFFASHVTWAKNVIITSSPVKILDDLPVLEPIFETAEPSSSNLLTENILSGSVDRASFTNLTVGEAEGLDQIAKGSFVLETILDSGLSNNLIHWPQSTFQVEIFAFYEMQNNSTKENQMLIKLLLTTARKDVESIKYIVIPIHLQKPGHFLTLVLKVSPGALNQKF